MPSSVPSHPNSNEKNSRGSVRLALLIVCVLLATISFVMADQNLLYNPFINSPPAGKAIQADYNGIMLKDTNGQHNTATFVNQSASSAQQPLKVVINDGSKDPSQTGFVTLEVSGKVNYSTANGANIPANVANFTYHYELQGTGGATFTNGGDGTTEGNFNGSQFNSNSTSQDFGQAIGTISFKPSSDSVAAAGNSNGKGFVLIITTKYPNGTSATGPTLQVKMTVGCPPAPGSSAHSIHSVFETSTGACCGTSPSFIKLDWEKGPDAQLASPALLAFVGTSSVKEVIPVTGEETVRQVLTDATLVDVTANSDGSGYKLAYYYSSDVGTKDSNGYYQPTGAPFKTTTVSCIAPYTTFRIVRQMTGGTQKVEQFTWNAAASNWSLQEGDGTQVQRTTQLVVTNPSSTVSVTQRTTSADGTSATIASKNAETVTSFPYGNRVTQEVLDPGGANLTTTSQYYLGTGSGGSASPNIEGELQSIRNPDGSWETYAYD